MKKVIDKIVELITDKNFLEFLWYITYVLWFGFVGKIIIASNQHIIVKILMIIGDLWWAFYAFIQYYDSTKD